MYVRTHPVKGEERAGAAAKVLDVIDTNQRSYQIPAQGIPIYTYICVYLCSVYASIKLRFDLSFVIDLNFEWTRLFVCRLSQVF